MSIQSLLNFKSELIHSSSAKCPVVLSTRVRLARNLDGFAFPSRAPWDMRRKIVDLSIMAIETIPQMKSGVFVRIEDLTDLEKQILYERHLISRELMSSRPGAAALISKDQSCIVMVNEEDHLRIQVLKNGFHFKKVWGLINCIDTTIEEYLTYAYSPKLGYLTACPTNLGTGMRVSAMMHLPALTLTNQMDKVVRAVHQLGIAVRGLFGEGSDASGSIFQISNQTTLGESEEEIIKRLATVLNTVIEQEVNARGRLLENDPAKILDKIGRARGLLRNSYRISSSEAMNLLSLIRLGVDLELFSTECRTIVDRLFIECQPGHVQYAHKHQVDSDKRDAIRAEFLREEFAKMPPPNFKKASIA